MTLKKQASSVLQNTDKSIIRRIETYPLGSLRAAGTMAEKIGNNQQERADYARILMRESRDLATYIIDKSR